MDRPLPDWLQVVTLRYQDSDQFTSGLVELPITYSGPSIPLEWPYTSVGTEALTTSAPVSSPAPLSPHVVKFYDGGGPFTVLGDVILTDSAAITSAPLTGTSVASPTPTPSAILVTSFVAPQPTPSTQSPSSNPGWATSNPLAIGFIVLLIILIFLVFATTVTLFNCRKRRKKHVGIIGKNYGHSPDDMHYEFSRGHYPHDHEGSPGRQDLSRNEIPILIHQNVGLDGHMREKELVQPEAQFLITPERRLKPPPLERWKKSILRLPIFRKENADRATLVYNQPIPTTTMCYANPYHDPSVNTETEERVSKWRTKCGSPSSSARRLPSTINSNKVDNSSDEKTSHVGLSRQGQAFLVDSIGYSNRNECREQNGVFSLNPSSTVSGPPGKLPRRGYQALKDPDTSNPTRTEFKHTRKAVNKPGSNFFHQSIAPGSLSKATAHVTRSLGALTKSSRSKSKASSSKRYSDDSPPLLIAECEGEGSGSEGTDRTDPGDSPLDFITIPLRSPPRCRRDTPVSSSAALTVLENSFDSFQSPPSFLPSSSSGPFKTPSKRVRPKKSSFPASPCPSLSNHLGLHTPRDDQTSAFKLTPSPTSQIIYPSPETPRLVPKRRGDLPAIKYRTPPSRSACRDTMGKSTPDDSIHCDDQGSRSDHTQQSDPRAAVPPIPPIDTQRSEETHTSSNDDDVIFNGYFGSGSIGNTGGVSELGILETDCSPDRLVIRNDVGKVGMEFPASVPASLQGSSELVGGEEYSYALEDLFYVKPQVGHVVSKSATEASHSRSPHLGRRLSASKALSKDSLMDADGRESSGKTSSYSEARRALEAANDIRDEPPCEPATRQPKNSLGPSARARSSYRSENPDGSSDGKVRRSVSSTLLGNFFSFGPQSRRCVSFPIGLENDPEARTSNHFLNIEPMLHETRSPLQRITERWREYSGREEDEEEEEDEDEIQSRRDSDSTDENEKDEDENSRLLLAQHAVNSRCSRATLGQCI